LDLDEVSRTRGPSDRRALARLRRRKDRAAKSSGGRGPPVSSRLDQTRRGRLLRGARLRLQQDERVRLRRVERVMGLAVGGRELRSELPEGRARGEPDRQPKCWRYRLRQEDGLRARANDGRL